MSGEPVDAPYTLSDMAADGIGLLDALDVGTRRTWSGPRWAA